MATTTSFATASSYSVDAEPDLPHNTGTTMTIKGPIGGPYDKAVYWFPGLPVQGDVTSATFRLYFPDGLPTGLWLYFQRVLEPWTEGELTANNYPLVDEDGLWYESLVEIQPGGYIDMDVTYIVEKSYLDGIPLYGLEVQTNEDWGAPVGGVVLAATRGVRNAWIQTNYLLADHYPYPNPPSDLRPSGGRAVESAAPRLYWYFRDQTWYQVDIDLVDTFDSPQLQTTGWVQTTQNSAPMLTMFPEWVAGTYPIHTVVIHEGELYIANTNDTVQEPPDTEWDSFLPVGGVLYWRVKCTSPSENRESAYTDTSFRREARGTLTLDEPSASVDTTMPKISWTLADAVQMSFAVEVQELQDDGSYAPIWSSGWKDATLTTIYPANATLWKSDANQYRVAVYVRDNVDRAILPGDQNIYSAAQIVTRYAASSPPDPAENLALGPITENGGELQWTSVSTPALWAIICDGQLWKLVTGSSASQGGDDYAYIVPQSSGTTSTWAVASLAVSGELAVDIPEIELEMPVLKNIWLIGDSPSKPSLCILGKDKVRFSLDSNPQFMWTAGQPVSMTREPPKGRVGEISGLFDLADYDILYTIYCLGKATLKFGTTTIEIKFGRAEMSVGDDDMVDVQIPWVELEAQ